MDFAHREYKTKCRFFRDSDIEVEIQWIRCADDAPDLGFPSAFMSIDWLDPGYDEPQDAEIGEVWGEDRDYSFHAPLVGLDYLHVCGTEDEFANGVAYDGSRDVKYDEQGLPLCCNNPITPSMGVVVGLEVEVDSLPVPGDTCPTSYLMAEGVALDFESSGLADMWFRGPITGFAVYHWRVSRITGDVDGSGQISFGADCVLAGSSVRPLLGNLPAVFPAGAPTGYLRLIPTVGSGVIRVSYHNGFAPP